MTLLCRNGWPYVSRNCGIYCWGFMVADCYPTSGDAYVCGIIIYAERKAKGWSDILIIWRVWIIKDISWVTCKSCVWLCRSVLDSLWWFLHFSLAYSWPLPLKYGYNICYYLRKATIMLIIKIWFNLNKWFWAFDIAWLDILYISMRGTVRVGILWNDAKFCISSKVFAAFPVVFTSLKNI